jgi:hypothetical protein
MGEDNQCRVCGAYISAGRWEIGKRVCLDCGELHSKQERQSWCVAPMHKSNYMLFTDKDLLVGLNNKGGLVR